MIILDTSTALEVVLGAAVSTNELEFQATYADTEQIDPGGASGVTNGTTDVTLVSAPSSGMRLIKQFTVFNLDTAAATVTIKLDDGTNERVVIERSIQPGQALAYDGCGFYVPFESETSYRTHAWIQDDGYYIGTDQVRARDGDGLLLTDDGGNGLKILDGGEVQTYPGGETLLDTSSTTDDLSEGSGNLYYTDERVDDRVNGLLASNNAITLTYDDAANTLTIGEGHSASTSNPHSVTASQVSAIASVDGVSNPGGDIDLANGGNVTITPDDTGNKITISVPNDLTVISNYSTDDLSEGSSNFYYTDSRVDSHLSGGDGISYSAGAITVDSTVLRGADIGTTDSEIPTNADLPNSSQVTAEAGSANAEKLVKTNSYGYISQLVPSGYGIRWDHVNDTVQAGVVVDGKFYGTDYGTYPIQEQMGRGLLTNTEDWTKLDSNDTSKYPDGTSATLDGGAGQIATRIPQFYQNVQRDSQYVWFLNGDRPFAFNGVASWIPKGFYKGQSTPRPQRYCGAFEAVAASDSTSAIAKSIVKDTSGYSMSYPNPFTNRTRGDFRSQCNDGIFHQMDYALWEIIAILFLTEFKTWNSQNALPGYTERGSWDYSYTSQAGETVSLGDASGSIYDDGLGLYIANSFRGIENPFGNIRKWLDGINIDNTSGNVHIYTCYDPTDFADDTTTDYVDTGHAPGFGDTNDYIKDILGQGQLCPFYPAELGGDSSSYITDHNYNNAGDWRVLAVSGNLSHGGPAGLAFLHANYASSRSNVSIGARSAA